LCGVLRAIAAGGAAAAAGCCWLLLRLLAAAAAACCWLLLPPPLVLCQAAPGFREVFHIREFVFCASSLEDIFLFLASTRLRNNGSASITRTPSLATTSSKGSSSPLTAMRSASFRPGRRYTHDERDVAASVSTAATSSPAASPPVGSLNASSSSANPSSFYASATVVSSEAFLSHRPHNSSNSNSKQLQVNTSKAKATTAAAAGGGGRTWPPTQLIAAANKQKKKKRTKKRGTNLSRFFRAQGKGSGFRHDGASTAEAVGRRRRRNQACLLLGKRVILNCRGTNSLLLVWCLGIVATVLSYFFKLPYAIPVATNIALAHDVTTSSLVLAQPNKPLIVFVSDDVNGTTVATAATRNATYAVVDAFNEAAAASPQVFPKAYFLEGGLAEMQNILSKLDNNVNLSLGGLLINGLDPDNPQGAAAVANISHFSWPWTSDEAVHIKLQALSNVTVIYNSYLMAGQLAIANVLDSLRLNLIMLGPSFPNTTITTNNNNDYGHADDDSVQEVDQDNDDDPDDDDHETSVVVVPPSRLSSSSPSPTTTTTTSRMLNIQTYYEALPTTENETQPNDDIVSAQFLYVTLGMGPLFGTVAHHVLAERENNFYLLQELCLMSPFTYWTTLFTADALTLVLVPFLASMVIQTLFDPCTFGGLLVDEYHVTIVLFVLYVLCAASIMAGVYLFTLLFTGRGARANTALFLTLLLFTLGTVTFNAIFTVVYALVPPDNWGVQVFSFIVFCAFPPYAMLNGLYTLVGRS
jgi:hypothetical protein